MKSLSKRFFRCIQNGGQELQKAITRQSGEASPIPPSDQIVLAIDSISFNPSSLPAELGTCEFWSRESVLFERFAFVQYSGRMPSGAALASSAEVSLREPPGG